MKPSLILLIIGILLYSYGGELGLASKMLEKSSNSVKQSITEYGERQHKSREKYFIFSMLMGRLNNQIITMTSSIYWSRILKRTLVFPGWNEHVLREDGKIINQANVPFEKYFDLDYFRANFKRIIYRDDYESIILPTLGNRDIKFRTEIPNIYFNKNFTREYLLEQLKGEKAIHLQVGVPYRWNFPQEDYERIMAYFRPIKEILVTAESYISRNLERPYAAIHLRRWEGACQMNASEIVSIIEGKLSKVDYRSVFLASDGQDPDLQNLIMRKYNAKILNYDLSSIGIYANGIMDGYIMSNSNLYFANRQSNLSRNWYRYRLGICKSALRAGMCKKDKVSILCEEFHRTEQLCKQDFEVVLMIPHNISAVCR